MNNYDPNQTCDNCGTLGAFHITNLYLCIKCQQPEKPPPKVYPEIEWLGMCENCFQHGVAKDGICVYCGSGPRVGTDEC